MSEANNPAKLGNRKHYWNSFTQHTLSRHWWAQLLGTDPMRDITWHIHEALHNTHQRWEMRSIDKPKAWTSFSWPWAKRITQRSWEIKEKVKMVIWAGLLAGHQYWNRIKAAAHLLVELNGNCLSHAMDNGHKQFVLSGHFMWEDLLVTQQHLHQEVHMGTITWLLFVICNSVKMGIRLCYKWDEPK